MYLYVEHSYDRIQFATGRKLLQRVSVLGSSTRIAARYDVVQKRRKRDNVPGSTRTHIPVGFNMCHVNVCVHSYYSIDCFQKVSGTYNDEALFEISF